MKKTGIITALAAEAACLSKTTLAPAQVTELDTNILVTLCGMGGKRAKQATENLIRNGAEQIISFGMAGGLSPGLHSGDICLPRTVVTNKACQLPVDEDLHAEIRTLIEPGSETLIEDLFYSSDEVLTSSKQKTGIYQQFATVATDMESAGVLAAAQQQHIPAIVLRVIVDTATTQLPEAVLQHTDEFGQPRIPAFVCSLLRQPRQIPQLIKLARQFKQAQNSLKRLAAAISQQS